MQSDLQIGTTGKVSDIRYWGWVNAEAGIIKADGCSRVTQVRKPCCYEHDLAYYYGRDPRDAYRLWKDSHPEYWSAAKGISRRTVDNRFWTCCCSHSAVNRLSPMAAWRWAGVTLFAWRPWGSHRKQRPGI